MESVTDAFRQLFGDAHDLVVLLRSDRCLEAANPAFLERIGGAGIGVDFMRTVPPHARERVASALVRAAGGEEILVEVPHHDIDTQPVLSEYRFFPAEGGRVAGIGRVRAALGGDSDTLERTRAELRAKNRMLDEIQLELTQVPFIDPVTGVWNRMQVFERLTAEWSRCERYGQPLSLLIVDVEALGSIRATDGREHADRLLKAVAGRVKAVVRDHDIVGRYGDDCFVIVAVNSDATGARSLGERLCLGVSGQPIAVDHQTTRLTVRVGGATNGSEGVEILEDLFQVAEQSLQAARQANDGVRVAEGALA